MCVIEQHPGTIIMVVMAVRMFVWPLVVGFLRELGIGKRG